MEQLIKENLVFLGGITKTAVCGLFISGLLSSCVLFNNDAVEIPNDSWVKGTNYGTKGDADAELATVAYSQGRFDEAEQHVANALRNNPRQPQALMVGALVYEKMGRLNRARQYYEDLTIVGTEEMTILGTKDSVPERMSEIARRRLRYLNMQQSEILVEDKDGVMTFNISQEASQRQGKSAMEEALFVREKKLIAENRASADADVKAVEVLFSDNEKNIISRFLIVKELAEKDLLTKQEFLDARMANIGGLLPLTSIPAAEGVEKPVPSPDLIIERINSLKEAVEARAITPQEFSAERDLIIEAVLPAHPRQRLKPQAPAKDILTAAKNLRKLEVIHDLGLVTTSEKANEKQAIEKHLGINRMVDKPKPAIKSPEKISPAKSEPKAASKPEEKSAAVMKDEKPSLLNPNSPVKIVDVEEIEAMQVMIPEVTSPF